MPQTQHWFRNSNAFFKEVQYWASVFPALKIKSCTAPGWVGRGILQRFEGSIYVTLLQLDSHRGAWNRLNDLQTQKAKEYLEKRRLGMFLPKRGWGRHSNREILLTSLMNDGTSLFRDVFNPWISNARVEMSRSALGDLSKAFSPWEVCGPFPTPGREQSHPEHLRATFYIYRGSVCVHLHKMKQHGSEPGMKVRENSK